MRRIWAYIRRWWHCERGQCDAVNVISPTRTVVTCTCGIVWWSSDPDLRPGMIVRPVGKRRTLP